MLDILNDLKKDAWVEIDKTKIVESIPFIKSWETIRKIFNERKNRYKLKESFKDIWELPVMNRVVDEIIRHKDKKIIIVWDYDVDWTTGSYVLEFMMKRLWFDVEVLIPERTYWYWLNNHYVNEANEMWAKLIITVDNWTNSVEANNFANELWISVVITDHHNVDKIHIESDFVLNYNLYVDDDYAVWSYVAFRVWKALSEKMWSPIDKKIENDLLPLCAIATIADVWLLHWENRFIVENYLPMLAKVENGLFSMLALEFWWDWYFPNVWFWIAPVINAMWRYSRAREFYSMLALTDEDEISKAIEVLDWVNVKRRWYVQELTDSMSTQILENDKINIVVFWEDTLPWMLWLVASKLVNLNWRPSIALKDLWNWEFWWSARTWWFKLIEASEKIWEWLDIFFAWHQQACWVKMKKEDIEEFKKRFNSEFVELTDFDEIEVDTLLNTPNDILDSEITFIENALWWHKFEWPSFWTLWLRISNIKELWKTWEHFKIFFKDSFWEEHVWIAFSSRSYVEKLRIWDTVDVTYSLEFNEWMWKTTRQMNISYIKKIK